MTIRLPALARHLPVRLGHHLLEWRRVRCLRRCFRRASAAVEADRANRLLVDEQPVLGAVMRVQGGHPCLMHGASAPLCALVA